MLYRCTEIQANKKPHHCSAACSYISILMPSCTYSAHIRRECKVSLLAASPLITLSMPCPDTVTNLKRASFSIGEEV
ncbi:hypothetical protein [Photobacterium makurazakiensis]|uniref:hypothetical protein n=1 Tax=Photobacterium makurazakiensis TaxID=2910234 RepID=UPI003D0C2FE5